MVNGFLSTLPRNTGGACTVINFHMKGALDRDKAMSHNVYKAGTSRLLASIMRHAGVRHVSKRIGCVSSGNR